MPKVFACSNVAVDYFLYIEKYLKHAGFECESVYLLKEHIYRQKSKSAGLGKIWLRFLMYILYPLKLCWVVLWAPRQSIFIVTSNTFYAPLLVAILTKFKKGKLIHLLYDLYPDALIISGKLKSKSFGSGFLGKVTCWTQQLSSCTVYLGDFLACHAGHCWRQATLEKVIDISADASLFKPSIGDVREQTRIHYGGQLGRMHDAEALVSSIKQWNAETSLKNAFSFSFMLSGAQAGFLREELSEHGVGIADTIPSDQWRECIREFDVGLVSLLPGGATVCLPSKTYSMMAGGLAILAVCPLWSDLAQLILDNDVGWVVPNSPYTSREELFGDEYLLKTQEKIPHKQVGERFVAVLEHISLNPEEVNRKRNNARNCMVHKFGLNELSLQWKDVLDDLGR